MIPYNSLPSVRQHLLTHLICSELRLGRQMGFDPSIALEEVRERYRSYLPDELDEVARCVEQGLDIALAAAVGMIRERLPDSRVLEAIRQELEDSVGPIKDVAGSVTIAFRLAEARFCRRALRDEGWA